MASGHLASYNKVHFKEDAGFETTTIRQGLMPIIRDPGHLIGKGEELHTTTGAGMKILILPTWKGWKAKIYESPNFLDLQKGELEQEGSAENVEPFVEEAADTSEAIPSAAPSPHKEPLSEFHNAINVQI